VSLGVLLLGTAVLYLWNLAANGWGNAFYAAAIQAGSKSWEAFLFGSSDAGNSITVDKPPASLWLPALSVRIFGLNSWSVLVPEALMGVASVWLLYCTVARVSGRWVGIVAGTALATTPVALLMFRYDNPEALLILLTVAACWAVVRAVQASATAADPSQGAAGAGRLRARRDHGPVAWLLLAGACIGLGFLTKQLQAVVVLPTLGLAYLTLSRAGWLKRVAHLAAAAGAVVVSAGWWVALVELWPSGSRPYIGGSQTDSFLELTFGYNGLGRLNGEEDGSVGKQWGTPGLLRLVTGNYVSQISWLIPAALFLLVLCVVLAVRDRAWRHDAGRARMAALVLLGGWFLVEGLTISLMRGITHEYYTAILAAPLAGVVGIGGGWLWERRTWASSICLGAAVAIVAATGAVVLVDAGWGTTWGVACAVLGVLAAVALAVRPLWATRLPRVAAATVLGAALVGALGAQTAFAASTTAVAKTGSIIYAGPAERMGAPGGGRGGFGAGPGGQGAPGGFGGRNGQAGQAAGGAGGLLGAGTPNAEMVTLLSENASDYRWAAATVGAQNAAGYQLATEASVMPIGGFNGTDPSPTLEQFQAYVQQGQIHYFIASGGMGGAGGSGESTASAITAWVEANYTATTAGGTTVYDLTQPNA